jgi:acetyltransferase-like isoleucine patch superfamily enzyme
MKRQVIKIAKWLYKKCFYEEKQIKYKHGTHFYSNTHIDSLCPQFVEIGNNFISAPGSLITAHDASTFLFSKKYRVEKVKIGDNVFLGANSVVLPGITIGNNVIIGAGSVVTKDIPSDSVYAGNPAKFICAVTEYIDKCTVKNILYDVPYSFLQEYESGSKFSVKSINQFQEIVLKESQLRFPKGK